MFFTDQLVISGDQSLQFISVDFELNFLSWSKLYQLNAIFFLSPVGLNIKVFFNIHPILSLNISSMKQKKEDKVHTLTPGQIKKIFTIEISSIFTFYPVPHIYFHFPHIPHWLFQFIQYDPEFYDY